MGRSLLVYVFCSSLCLTLNAAQKSIVFDLDGVVLYHAPSDSRGEGIIRVQNDTTRGGDVAAQKNVYRVADGFPELVDHLLKTGWKIHFFSFGTQTRNESALSQIKMPGSERSVLEAIREKGGKVFSNQDGLNLDPTDTRTVIDTSLPKAQRPKIVKSLAKVLGEEAKGALLVEDILANAAPGERDAQTIFLPYKWVLDPEGTEVKFLEDNAETVRRSLSSENLEQMRIANDRFYRLRNKIAYLAGLLDRVEKGASRTGKSYSEVLQSLQWARDAQGNFIEKDGERVFNETLLDGRDIIQRGVSILESIESGQYEEVLPIKETTLCIQYYQKLDRLLQFQVSAR